MALFTVFAALICMFVLIGHANADEPVVADEHECWPGQVFEGGHQAQYGFGETLLSARAHLRPEAPFGQHSQFHFASQNGTAG